MFVAAYPLPPINMSPADDWLPVALVAAALTFGVSVVLALRSWRKTGSALWLACLAGGIVCASVEPIVDTIGLCWFPKSQTAFETFGRSIPWWVVFSYGNFFGNLPYLFCRAFEKGITKRFFWQALAVGFVFNAVIEVPVLQAGVYTYYGNQPFNLGGFPLWWMFVNTGGALTAGMILWHFRSVLRTRPGLIGAVPLLTGPVYLAWSVAVGLPLHSALNSAAPMSVTTIAGLVTIGLCVAAFHAYTQIACTDGNWSVDRHERHPEMNLSSYPAFSVEPDGGHAWSRSGA